MKLNAISEVEAIEMKIQQEKKVASIVVLCLAVLMVVTAVTVLAESL